MKAKMDQPPRELAIVYRVYPKVAKSAVGLPFCDNKLKISEICLRSFKESLGDLRVKIWVLLDGCPEEYMDLFRRYFEAEDLVLVRLPGIGNRATFAKQIEILLEQAESDLVYFAEDDYIYLPNEFPRMINFLRGHPDVHFVTPYDHLDCYTLEIHRHPKWVRVYGGRHWRTAASTCLTFLTRKETLQHKKRVFQSYCGQNFDCSLWLSLTKKTLYNPLKIIRFLQSDRHFVKIVAKSWLYCWPQVLFGERMKLWSPIPAIATHLDVKALSPTIDWQTLIKREAEAAGLERLDEQSSFGASQKALLGVGGVDER